MATFNAEVEVVVLVMDESISYEKAPPLAAGRTEGRVMGSGAGVHVVTTAQKVFRMMG